VTTGRSITSKRYSAQIPNSLTVIRILIAFAFPLVSEWWRLPLLTVALATEYLDGALSRWFHWQSQLGQILDPIADKVFFASVAITFIVDGRLDLWECLLLVIRDLLVVIGTVWLLLRSTENAFTGMKPNIFGKITTVLQYGSLLFLVVNARLNLVLLLITAASGSLAACGYFLPFIRKKRVGTPDGCRTDVRLD